MAKREGLIACRKALGLSQEDLAYRVGVAPETVRRWENGAGPGPGKAPLLAKALGIKRAELARLLVEGKPADDSCGTHGASTATIAFVTTSAPPRSGLELTDWPSPFEATRRSLDRTLATGSVTPAQLDAYEELLLQERRSYCRTPPVLVLPGLHADVEEVGALAAQRQPARIQARLSGLLAQWATLIADALMRLGRLRDARSWYATATVAADDTDEPSLRALVRAQAAMLPYYYGGPEEALRLAHEARILVEGVSNSAALLAHAAEARAMSRLGHPSTEDAIRRLYAVYEARQEPDESQTALVFTEARLLLYMSGILTNLADTARARAIQEAALALPAMSVGIDGVLVQLDRAICMAHDTYAVDAVQHAQQTLSQMPEEQRTDIVRTRAHDLLDAIAPRDRALKPITSFRELVAAPSALRHA